MAEQRKGGCACGAVRYTVVATAWDVGDCHCRTCQRAVGAAYVTWASVAADTVDITGHVRWWQSSERAERGFCGVCGTSLFYRPLRGGYLDLAVATLDDPSDVAPTYAIWVTTKQPWVHLDPTHPAYADSGPDV